MNAVEGGVCAPKGYTAGVAGAGVKPGTSRLDCGLIVSEGPAVAAGVFTRNIVKAAPVTWCQACCARGQVQAIFVNSGNANACTGPQGDEDVRTIAETVGKKLGIAPELVAVCSTGLIGARLPMDRIQRGIGQAAANRSEYGSRSCAEAMMTTDTVPKEAALEISLEGGATVRIGGIAKGAGMLAPNMATMLAFVTTDAAISCDALQGFLAEAVDKSFNSISVDNDTSTNDTVLLLANGAADAPPLEPGTPDGERFREALDALCRDLALQLVRDGEGAEKLVTIHVRGAASDGEARQVARAIGCSQLCKTAFHGEDPNWGRIACAAGYAGVDFDPGALGICLNDMVLVRKGQAADYVDEEAQALMQHETFTFTVDIGTGLGEAVFWTTDLSHEYIRINADYRS